MQNTTFFKQINTLIKQQSIQHLYKFPNIDAQGMIDFERAYTNNYYNPILIFIRQDINDINNSRTYYLYQINNKTYEVYVIVINGLSRKYVQPYKNASF